MFPLLFLPFPTPYSAMAISSPFPSSPFSSPRSATVPFGYSFLPLSPLCCCVSFISPSLLYIPLCPLAAFPLIPFHLFSIFRVPLRCFPPLPSFFLFSSSSLLLRFISILPVPKFLFHPYLSNVFFFHLYFPHFSFLCFSFLTSFIGIRLLLRPFFLLTLFS